jgi:hypothetical protein
MRCVSCKNFLTRLEVVEAWEKAEADIAAGEEKPMGVCPCGSRQMKPGNLTPEEEEIYCSERERRRYYDDKIDDRGTRVWKLFDKCIDGKDLGDLYPQEG